MTLEDFKVNSIYFWEKHHDAIRNTLILLFSPILVPVFIFLVIPFILWRNNMVEDDMKWCRENLMNYPKDKSEDEAHRIVKSWRKDKKRQIKELEKKIEMAEKELIRIRLRERKYGKNNIED